MQNFPKEIGCCGKIHAKICEIILIIGFISGAIFITINFAMTMWFFKFSLYLFAIEIALLALNVFCVIFSILLRVWRSNGSVMKGNNSSSHCISICIIVILIINILGSLAEDALFYFIFYILNMDDDDEDNIDPQKMLKIIEMYGKIMNKMKKGNSPNMKDENQLKLLKLIPWICINANILVQIIAIIFVILLIKRIKKKSDYDVSMGFMNQNSQQAPFQNQIDTNKNSVFGISAKKGDVKGNKKKGKKKKAEDHKNEMISNPDSDQIEIRNNKKGKKKKNANKKNKKK